VPKLAPLPRLDARFAAWDQLAAELPALYRDLSLRKHAEALPLLDASEQNLEDRELLRAAALLAIVAHGYWYSEPKPPETLPPALQLPWQQLRARLERSQEVMTYTDLIVYNWRVLNPALPDPLRVENTALLIPTIGNREESVFYLTQLEILARASAIVRAFVSAHEGVLRDDVDAVERALVEIIDCLDRIVSDSLLKISPNPYSKTFVDPVVWAKTVAPLAVPFHQGDQGPSGTSSPIFSALDLFFRRPKNSSFLGREIEQLRQHYPAFWRQFLSGLSQVSVVDFVQARDKPALRGALREAMELYSGEHGFLGRHRMKVYGYLELAFKVGRSVTIGGFSGAFTDRTWDQVDGELEAARNERHARRPESYQRALVEQVLPGPARGAAGIQRVLLDVAESGVRFRTGSRCAVLPENRVEVVEKTLRALSANGDEHVPLTDEWRKALRLRLGEEPGPSLPLRELLRFGAIRPVSPRVAEALHARTQDARVLAQMRMGTTARWELWELVALLSSTGLSPRTLWQDAAGQVDDRLARLIPPERSRLYSISAVEQPAPGAPPRTIELTVGQLRYSSEPARLTVSPPSNVQVGGARLSLGGDERFARQGTASSFLVHAKEEGRPVRFRIERPARFQPPPDPDQPLVLFAAGTGIAPYRAFIQDRARASSKGLCWLLLSLRTPSEFQLGEELAAANFVRLSVAFTREGADLALDPERGFVAVPGPTRRIEDLLADEATQRELFKLVRAPEEGGGGAAVYVCGRSGFASTVIRVLEDVFQRQLDLERPGHARRGREFLRKLAGVGRLVFGLTISRRSRSWLYRW
jgi:sulfite reductase (NADPH) flavoprotein alpha-component